MSEAASSRHDRNIAAFERHFPQLHDALSRLGPCNSRVVGSAETGDLNLDLGHTLFYTGDAVSFAETQLDKWRVTPGRFYMDPPPRHDPPGQQQYFVSEALHAHFEGRPLPVVPVTPTVDGGGFMLVYGIGLGCHLPALFAEAPVRHFVLIEEHLEFFRHTLDLLDWDVLLERLIENGQTLNFVIGTDPAVVAGRVHWHMRGRGFGLIDGSYLFRHYSSTLLDLAYADFIKKLPLLPISIGFFEDELVMLANTTENLVCNQFRYMAAKPRREMDLPAFIVGSGPSFDKTSEHLRRLSGQAVIFSCGTSLQPLLAAGIRPDFHCELENVQSSVLQLKRGAERFDLAGITLLASTSVHPDMLKLFGDHIFYFRDSVCSTPLWCPGGLGIHGTAPTCTNLALRAALVMAFRDIYLFGVDLGTRVVGTHHASNTIYHQEPGWQEAQETDPVKIMNIELPANFGGKSFTNQILHWARMMMAQAIDAFSFARIYNCSDGASIPGTLPRLAQSIKLTVPPGRKAVALGRLLRDLEPVEPGAMAPIETLVALRAALREHYAAMRDEIARALEDGSGFIDFYEAIRPLLERKGARPFQPVLRAVNIGTIMMCFQIGYYFYRRVSEDEQEAVMRVFLTALDERLVVMADTIDALVDRLEALRPPSPPLGEGRGGGVRTAGVPAALD